MLPFHHEEGQQDRQEMLCCLHLMLVLMATLQAYSSYKMTAPKTGQSVDSFLKCRVQLDKSP